MQYENCKSAVVAISHEFSERDGKLIFSGLKPEFLKLVTITASSFDEIITMTFPKDCKFICGRKLLSFPLTDLVSRLNLRKETDPLMSFWPMTQAYTNEQLPFVMKLIKYDDSTPCLENDAAQILVNCMLRLNANIFQIMNEYCLMFVHCSLHQ
jgi:hypothetical protein